MTQDSILRFMTEHGLTMDRETYLDVAFFGNPPEVLDAEEELSLPEQFQLNPPEEFE